MTEEEELDLACEQWAARMDAMRTGVQRTSLRLDLETWLLNEHVQYPCRVRINIEHDSICLHDVARIEYDDEDGFLMLYEENGNVLAKVEVYGFSETIYYPPDFDLDKQFRNLVVLYASRPQPRD